MFSFFRKSRASKDSKLGQQQQQHNPPVEDGNLAAEGSSKKKLPSAADKKTNNKDKKVSFKDADQVIDPVTKEPATIIQQQLDQSPTTEEKENHHLLQLEEPPDVFCEAQETIQPVTTESDRQDNLVVVVESVASDLADEAIKSVSKLSSNETAAGDVNPNDSDAQDVTQCKLPLTMKKSHPEVPSTAPFLSGGSASACEKQIAVQPDAEMSTRDDPQGQQDVLPTLMEDQLRQLQLELKEKNERVEQLEALLADEDRLAQLETLERLEADWNREHELVENEREEEMRLLQEALEEALEEKAEMESKMIRDASRETQLLDDFEWKLGEIEKDYKKKLVEAEKSVEERVKKEMATEFQQLMDDKRDIDEKLEQIAHLKSYEAEVTQLRGLIHEQQRAIRVASRQIDQLRVNERLLQDDLNKIKTQGCTRKQQQEMEEKWEEKTQTECNRLRAELIATNEEEMLKAIRQVVHEKDDQINALKRQFEAQQITLNHQLNEQKISFQQRESKLNQQLEMTRTAADRELNDLRRQLNKVQDSHVELLEQMERKHAEELERFGSIKSQNQAILEQEFEEKLQSVQVQHQSQLNALQALIEEEKQEALTQLGEHYQHQLQSLQEHITDLQKRLSDANKLSSLKEEELAKLRHMMAEQEQQLEQLNSLHQEQEDQSNNEIKSCRRRHSDDSTTAESSSSSSGGEDEGSTPPTNGRSAGDGCSPSTSAATIQDTTNKLMMADGSRSQDQEQVASPFLSMAVDQELDHIESPSVLMCCDDPDHAEAQQIILEMHQVLADRDAELQRLTEEKRFYQLELIHWERNLALQRVGLPLALVPDRLSNGDSELNPWRGYSAPPVTKPRLPSDSLQFSTAAAFGSGGHSRAASYELFSPSATSLSPELVEHQLFPDNPSSVLLDPADCWLNLDRSDRRQQPIHHWPPPQDSRFYYSDDDDDDSNNNGFTTPL